MPVIDAHAHVISPDTSNFPLRPGATVPDHAREMVTDSEALIAAMDDAGVERAVIVQRAAVYGHDNRYVLATSHHHPARLSAVVSVDPLSPDANERIRGYVDGEGARGIRLAEPTLSITATSPVEDWLGVEFARPIWTAASDLHIPVCVHLTRRNREYGIRRLAQMVLQFPEVDLVVDHLANCVVEEGPPDFGLDALEPLHRSNVHFKVSPVNFRYLNYSTEAAALLVHAAARFFGADHLLLGSDITNTPGTYKELVSQCLDSTSLLEPEACALVLGGTASRLYS